MRLNIRNIVLRYRDKEVLRGCSYDFRPEGIHILTGENGSGKSTLLRVCSLLEAPDRGTVEFFENGSPLPQDIRLRRRITLVLPRVGLFNTSVYENVVYGLKLRKVAESSIRKKAADALDFVGLSEKSKQNALTLSSGESQRLGIARALILEPEILFLDEPTASVDKKNIAIIEDIVQKLKGEKMIIIMATHDELQAKRLGDKVLLMDNGIIVDTEPQAVEGKQ